MGRRRRRGLRPAEMDLAGTIILLCSCAAGAGGEEPPGLAGPWFGAVSFPPCLFLLSLSPVSGAWGRGRWAPLSGAPRLQGRGWAASRAPRSARRFSPPAALPLRPRPAWRPRPFPGTFPAEDRVSCSPLFFPLGSFGCVCFPLPALLPYFGTSRPVPVVASRLPSLALAAASLSPKPGRTGRRKFSLRQ